MLTKRIIPCLDVKDGRVVKGTNFVNLKDAGNVVELAERYYEEGADELVFLDITATEEKRKLLVNLVKDAAEVLRIPFTVGGGLNTVPLIEEILKSGADKVSLNSAIVNNPELITESAKAFGSQAVVAAVDVKKVNGGYTVYIQGGKIETEKEGFAWCREVEDRGAGEILLTAMDRDGTRIGYDTEFLEKLTEMVSIPVIASGGAGNMQHFADAFYAGADAALAAGLFHFNEMQISDLKKFLKEKDIPVRV